MYPQEINKAVAARILTSKIVWVAITGAVGIYLALGYILLNMTAYKAPPEAPPQFLSYILMWAGISSTVLGVLIGTGKLPLIKITGDSPEAVSAKVFSRMVISWALCESAAIMGLVIFFLFVSLDDLFLMSAVAVAGLIVLFPTESKFTG